jgi:hypothetical protein
VKCRLGVGDPELRGHLTRYPFLTPCLAAALGEQTAVERVVGRFKEDRLAVIAALGHVMRKSSGNDAAEACHGSVWHSSNWCDR